MWPENSLNFSVILSISSSKSNHVYLFDIIRVMLRVSVRVKVAVGKRVELELGMFRDRDTGR